MRRFHSALAIVAMLVIVAAACSKSTPSGGGGGASKLPTKIGQGEGALSLVAWPGYVESGENDPDFDWVTPFEQQTGCKVTVKYGNTSDEMVNLMRQGQGKLYDGVSASGDASNRLIAAGDVAEVNVKLIPAFNEMIPALQSPPHNTIEGHHYGVPYMWGPNFLMYNTDVVSPAPDTWDVVFDPSSQWADQVKGKVTAYDSPIYIADAALYLKTHDPSLGIEDPYELTSAQLDAAVNLLEQQAPLINKYWAVYTDEISGFESGDMAVGTAWPVNLATIESDAKVKVESVIPSEGVTGWADTWMMSKNAPHPNCMYEWMAWTSQADVQTEVAEYYGATPSNAASCDQLRKDIGESADSAYHCGDQAFLEAIALWKTPLADCGDGRMDCTDYSVWTEKWTEIRGA
jgi:putative spermidine/putrescine transport system substrate-binding protein